MTIKVITTRKATSDIWPAFLVRSSTLLLSVSLCVCFLPERAKHCLCRAVCSVLLCCAVECVSVLSFIFRLALHRTKIFEQTEKDYAMCSFIY